MELLDEGGTQNYLVFQAVYKYFEINNGRITSWESKELSNQKSTSASSHHNDILPKLVYNNGRIDLKLSKIPLRQDKVTYNHGPILSIYIVFKLVSSPKTINVTLQDCLFGAVKLTKNADIDKYKYSGYGIGFNSRESFTHPSRGYGKNVTLFGADLSSSKHPNIKTRSSLVLGSHFIQGIDGTTIYAEKKYSTNFTVDNKTFCFSLHYNGDNSYLYLSMEKKHQI